MKPKTNEQLCVLAQRGDAQAQEQLVKNNLGLAFLPEPMALESLAKQEVLQIAISEKLPLRHICLVHDHQHL